MSLTKSLLVAGVATGIAFASVAGVSAANSNQTDGRDGLINKIATKFNLQPEEVKAVFDEQRAERQAEADQRIEEKLNKLVSEGKLTETQKAAILAKRAEIKKDLETNRESFKDKTPTERSAEMKAKKAELETWAKDNNIPTEYLHFVFGHGRHGHGHWKQSKNDTKAPESRPERGNVDSGTE